MLPNIFSALISIVLTAALGLPTTAPSSNPNPIPMPTQDPGYQQAWRAIDSLENQGLVRSALEQVQALRERLREDQALPHIARAIIYENKYQSQLEEDGMAKAIKRMEGEAAAAPAPLKPVVHSLLGELYSRYLQERYWQLRGRTPVTGERPDDIKLWDIPQLLDAAAAHYLASVEDTSTFNIPITEWRPITMQLEEEAVALRPTLYDFLLHRAVDYFSNGRSFLSEPVYQFVLRDSAAFAPARAFASHTWAAQDTSALSLRALQLFQKGLRLRLSGNSPSALADLDLKRLQFVYQQYTGPDKEAQYEKALSQAAQAYPETAEQAMALHALSRFYYQQSLSYEPFQDTAYRWKAALALKTAQQAIADFPESYGAKQCESLISQIQQPSLTVHGEQVVLPGQPVLIGLHYKNLPKLYTRLIVLPATEWQQQQSFRNSEALQQLARQEPQFEKAIALPSPADYQHHRTEFALPAPAAGHYVMLYSDNPGFEGQEALSGALFFTVTQAGALYQQSTGQLLLAHRLTGEPLRGIPATFYRQEYNPQKRQSEWKKIGQGESGPDGFLDLTAYGRRGTYLMLKEGQTDILLPSSLSFYPNSKADQSGLEARFFLDRAIYRPGQTIYFKALVMKRDKDGLPQVAAKQPVVVTLRDANYQEAAKLNLRANEYGTVQGSFTAPSNGLQGQMQLQADIGGSISFSVESYKRPKFEVSLLPLSGTPSLGDTVAIQGKAQDYAGPAVGQATVRYRVVRQTRFPWWDWWRPLPPYGREEQEIAQGETATTVDGAFEITFPALPDPTVPATAFPEFTYAVQAEVTDGTGETQAAVRTVRLAYLRLKASLQVAAQADRSAGSLSIGVATQNLDGQPQAAQGQVEVYALQGPGRPMVNRYWPRPDLPLLSREDFAEQFPYLPYEQESEPAFWPEGQLAYQTEMETKGSDSLSIPVQDWAPGYYKIKAAFIGPDGKAVRTQAIVHLYDAKTRQVSEAVAAWMAPETPNPLEPGEAASVLLASAGGQWHIWAESERSGGEQVGEWLKGASWYRYTLPLTEADRGGAFLHFQAVRFNRAFSWQHRVEVPWSNKKLQISYGTFRDKLQPGSEEEWSLIIEGPGGEAVSAEVLASMYDASLDVFRPNSWWLSPYPSNYSRNYWSAQSFTGIYGMAYQQPGIAPGPGARTYPQLNWFRWGNYYYRGAVQQRNMPQPEMAPMMDSAAAMEEVSSTAMPAPGAKKAEATGGGQPPEETGYSGQEALPPPPPRTNLKETVFFFPELRTDADGRVILKFRMNEALTRWKFQVLAHTQDLSYAASAREVVTQKELMVLPNPPRFVREGDRLRLPAKVSNLSGKAIKGQARLELFDALTMQPIDLEWGNLAPQKGFQLEAEGSQTLYWDLAVPKGSAGAIVHRITAQAGAFTDGEEQYLPVLTNRMLVTESMPLPLGGSEERSFRFESMEAAMQSTTATPHQFSLEYTPNPAWYAVKALPYLMEQGNACTEFLFNRYYANALASTLAQQTPGLQRIFDQWRASDALLSELERNEDLKQMVLEQTPWLRDAQGETAQRKRIALLFDLNRMAYEQETAVRELAKLQNPDGGFPWFAGGYSNWYITQALVQGIARLQAFGAGSQHSLAHSDALPQALRFLDEQAEAFYERQLKEEQLSLSPIMVHYLYTRGFFEETPLAKGAQTAYDAYLNLAKGEWLKQGLYEEAMLALVFQRQGWQKEAAGIVNSLRERALWDKELGMYWKQQGGYHWHELPIATHAMLMEAFAEVAPTDTVSIAQMKTWLLRHKQTNHWKTGKATADAVYALLRFGPNWLAESQPAEIRFPKGGRQAQEPLEAAMAETEAGTGYFRANWAASDITPSLATIEVANPNSGIAWGAAYYQYFEELDRVQEFKDTPLKLNKQLFLEVNTDEGPRLQALSEGATVQPGDKVVARIELRVDRPMEFVHLQDMRSSGLEPENVLSQYKWQGGLGYYETTKDASTDFFMDYLPKGTHVFQYALRAVHEGNFSNGTAQIQCLYAPEFSSHAQGIRLEVKRQ